MLVLFTDFGCQGPYVGQLKLALAAQAPHLPLIDLMHDAPRFNVRAAAYLLASYARELPRGAVVVAVVDPGVGSGACEPVVADIEGRWFVGPGNGLFDPLLMGAPQSDYRRITWRPPHLSNTFHGRDLFAPVAAMLATGVAVEQLATPLVWHAQGWPADLAEVIYIDHYGNAVTGLRAAQFSELSDCSVAGRRLRRRQTFADAAVGEPFFFANSSGLLEIAVNQGSAARSLALHIGTPLTLA